MGVGAAPSGLRPLRDDILIMLFARTHRIKGSDFHSPDQRVRFWKSIHGFAHIAHQVGCEVRYYRLSYLRSNRRPLNAHFEAANLYDTPKAQVHRKLPRRYRAK